MTSEDPRSTEPGPVKLDGRLNLAYLNWLLFAGILLLIGANAVIFSYPRWYAWYTSKPLRDPTEGEHQVTCLKVSEFYSVHLATYFLAASKDSGGDPGSKATIYREYCDRVPGTGKVVFTIDLMEEDTRDQPVVLSLSQYDNEGRLTLVKALPPTVHPHGVLTLDTEVTEKGKYLLRLLFGKGKSKDEIIEMPIFVGQ